MSVIRCMLRLNLFAQHPKCSWLYYKDLIPFIVLHLLSFRFHFHSIMLCCFEVIHNTYEHPHIHNSNVCQHKTYIKNYCFFSFTFPFYLLVRSLVVTTLYRYFMYAYELCTLRVSFSVKALLQFCENNNTPNLENFLDERTSFNNIQL